MQREHLAQAPTAEMSHHETWAKINLPWVAFAKSLVAAMRKVTSIVQSFPFCIEEVRRANMSERAEQWICLISGFSLWGSSLSSSVFFAFLGRFVLYLLHLMLSCHLGLEMHPFLLAFWKVGFQITPWCSGFHGYLLHWLPFVSYHSLLLFSFSFFWLVGLRNFCSCVFKQSYLCFIGCL